MPRRRWRACFDPKSLQIVPICVAITEVHEIAVASMHAEDTTRMLDGAPVIRGSIVGTREDLAEAVAFAAQGKVRSRIHPGKFEDINRVFADLRAGRMDGRIVLAMNQESSCCSASMPSKAQDILNDRRGLLVGELRIGHRHWQGLFIPVSRGNEMPQTLFVDTWPARNVRERRSRLSQAVEIPDQEPPHGRQSR